MSTKRTKVLVVVAVFVVLCIAGFIIFGMLSGKHTVTWRVNKPNPKLTRDNIINPLHEFVAAVKNHEKEKYLSLFGKNAAIEDPIGIEPFSSTEKEGNKEIAVFYESNLARNDITFISKEDIICGMDVFRDALVIISPEPGVEFRINSYSLYQMVEEGGRIKIDHLAAFWEINTVYKQMFQTGFKIIPVSIKNIWNILKDQGLAGFFGAMKANIGIKDKGKENVAAFIEAVNNKLPDKLITLFEDKNSAIEYNGSGIKYDVQSFIAGPMKSSKITADDLRSAGWFTACRYKLEDNGKKTRGIALFQFNPDSGKLTAVRFYWNK